MASIWRGRGWARWPDIDVQEVGEGKEDDTTCTTSYARAAYDMFAPPLAGVGEGGAPRTVAWR
jgi:hypothetical protein